MHMLSKVVRTTMLAMVFSFYCKLMDMPPHSLSYASSREMTPSLPMQSTHWVVRSELWGFGSFARDLDSHVRLCGLNCSFTMLPLVGNLASGRSSAKPLVQVAMATQTARLMCDVAKKHLLDIQQLLEAAPCTRNVHRCILEGSDGLVSNPHLHLSRQTAGANAGHTSAIGASIT